MTIVKILAAAFLLVVSAYGHEQSSALKFTYDTIDFENSARKDKGMAYGVAVDYKTENAFYQLFYEKTDTDTYQPPLMDDLHVQKYFLKYTCQLDQRQAFHISYATISDNIMKEVDGGNIYGIGYNYQNVDLTQYVSDYEHFNVYQTDLKLTLKKEFGQVKTATSLMGKYIALQNRDSNPFSKQANKNYLTPGIKIHGHYEDYHFGAGAFFGKRIFAVMDDGFKVQHHAMEFEKTYMCGIGRKFNDVDLQAKYVYQKATEVPINNSNIKVQNIIFQLSYSF
ncbi:MAG: hypothetical protein IE885_08305 [Campylobacterales bacterium]|nr:hypothetical protein [Campylobacterales bacterium]